MTDAQFQELLKHIDGIGDAVIISAITGVFIIFVAIAAHGWTRG